MSAHNKLRKHLYSSVGPALLAAMSLATSDASLAACSGPGAPTTTQTKCLTAVAIPAAPANKTGGLRSFDISWVDPDRAEYYLGDRANAGIDHCRYPKSEVQADHRGLCRHQAQRCRHRHQQ